MSSQPFKSRAAQHVTEIEGILSTVECRSPGLHRDAGWDGLDSLKGPYIGAGRDGSGVATYGRVLSTRTRNLTCKYA